MKLLAPIVALAALALGAAAVDAPADSTRARADCERTSTGLVPLTEMGGRRYRGYRGGLYPNGRNRPSTAYGRLGLAAARRVRPVDGKIVLLSIGMSNTTREFSDFKSRADRDPAKSASVQLVDGAETGWDAQRIKSPSSPYWELVDERLNAAEAYPDQVQAVWLKQAISGESRLFPRDARALHANLRAIVHILRARFPNLRLIFLSSRTYAGYAITARNPEPHAYDSAFAVRWLIRDRMQQKASGPWIGWGPYLWTDGTKGRRDGLTWDCDDVDNDGTHPSKIGAQKVSALLLEFFKSDSMARPWFRGRALPQSPR
ncbi:MAG: SGNH/GDSL hydrolase family protein [Actinobacteria bacterium]|nr:SGNH/GDSL hydrolase family protein [Actinomycetota bacterium]